MATLKAPRAFTSSLSRLCRQRLLPTTTRAFSTSPCPQANDPAIEGFSALYQGGRPRGSSARSGSSSPFGDESLAITDILDAPPESFLGPAFAQNLNESVEADKPHRLHIYSTKHNTHITFVQPSRSAAQTTSSAISGTSASAKDQKKQVDVLLSLSAGNIGFRKAGRGSYDAAYQLAAFTLKQIQEKGLLRDISRLEVVLRGFGAGREACTKALLGSEGRNIRHKITSVVDATRLKQGGPRSKKPRRLG